VEDAYDLVIIGGGSAGLMAAAFAVCLESRVAIVEKNRTGGDCTWTGCVPSKALLKAARVAHLMRHAERYGLPAVGPQINLKAVMAHVRDVVTEVYDEESPAALRADGIDVHLGGARFLNPHTVAAGDTTLNGRDFLIATGAHPFTPPIPGIKDVGYLTYEDIWELEVLPRRLLVLGAGPIGCEMAQAFQRLGSKVTLIEAEDHLLPRDIPQASQVLAEVFEAEGINLHLGAAAEWVWQDQEGIHLVAGSKELVGDALLVAAGRRPNVDGLDLDKAGVAYSDKGIQVNRNGRTSQRHIYAAGDCTGGLQFTHYAGWQGFLAARNALLPGASVCVTDQVPWTTFTDPEVAHVGKSEDDARAQFGDDVMTCEWPMNQVDRARTDVDTVGFLKLVHLANGTLLGATVVAERAGEMIHEFILAMDQGIKLGDLAYSIHVYPTYSTAINQAAATIKVEQFLSSTTGRVALRLARLMQ
jgi:pyruvate/2-oxoglutarate dehydrogenase complex dihydrolipoamide dehydrogenase (E3) component